jgi:hypothetical protein
VEYLIGLALALGVAGLGAGVGFDRERSFGSVIAIIVASYYVLFALMAAPNGNLVNELLIATAFSVVAIIGFKRNAWLIPAAIAGHGVFDFFHHSLIDNPGVPVWWPGFCMSFDVLFGAWLAVLLVRRSRAANHARP